MVLAANGFGVLSDIPACLQGDFASHGLDGYGWFGFWTGILLATVMVVIPKSRFKWLSRNGLDGVVGAIFVVVAMLTGHLLGVASKTLFQGISLCHNLREGEAAMVPNRASRIV
jgi:hypothetical protein